jgi:hypothetical protein
MTYKTIPDARLALLNHLGDFVAVFSSIDEGATMAAQVSHRRDVDEMVELMIRSLGLEIKSFSEKKMTVTLDLLNIDEFLDEIEEEYLVSEDLRDTDNE